MVTVPRLLGVKTRVRSVPAPVVRVAERAPSAEPRLRLAKLRGQDSSEGWPGRGHRDQELDPLG